MLLTKYKVLHFVLLRTAGETKIATPFLPVSGVIYWLQSQIIYWPHTFVNAPVPISPGVAAEEGQGGCHIFWSHIEQEPACCY